MRDLRDWWHRLRGRAAARVRATDAGTHHAQASESLRTLLDDASIPTSVRSSLASDFARLESMLAKLERDELHIAVFGRVSVGKSALANALLGDEPDRLGHRPDDPVGEEEGRDHRGDQGDRRDDEAPPQLDEVLPQRHALVAPGAALRP